MTGGADDQRFVADRVREGDRPRYYSVLFAPAAVRPALFALYALGAETARIPEAVREPALGEIRLQWWRDSVAAIGRGEEVGGSPVLTALAAAARGHSLPVAPLLALIDARRGDLYSDPPPTRIDLEGFLGETESTLFQLSAIVLGSEGPETAEAAGHAGVAYGLAQRLAAIGVFRARAIPVLSADMLAAHGLSAAEFLGSPDGRRAAAATADAVALARRHARLAREAPIPAAARPAFLPLAIVEPLLARVERRGPTLLSGAPAAISDLETLARFAIRSVLR